MGQTNYKQIIGLAGPCFYPAGHLWHYAPFYKLATSIDSWFLILKFVTYYLETQ